MPQQATTSVLATIKGMHFFIRRAHGISSGFYTSTAAALILGVLQGSGAAPCIWICLSYILLQALQSHTTGISSHLPTQHPHIPTSRQSQFRRYRLVAYRHLPLHPKHETHLLHAKIGAGLGTPIICKWRHTGTPEMLLLSSPVAMDSPRLSSHEPDHQQPTNSPPNDLRKVNLPYPHTQD